MKLIFDRQEIDYNKTPSSDDLIEKINELLAEGYFFSHFIADGTEIYEDYEDYLNVNLGRIMKLEVIAKTEKEFLNDVLISAEDYFKRAKPDTAALPDSFSNQPTSETWSKFEMLLEGVQWLYDMLTVVGGSEARPSNWDAYAELAVVLQGDLAKLGQVVEKGDHVEIGTIIRDDIILNFAALEIEIGKTLDSEGVRQNLN